VQTNAVTERHVYRWSFLRVGYELLISLALSGATAWFAERPDLALPLRVAFWAVSPYPLFFWLLTVLTGPREIVTVGDEVQVKFWSGRLARWRLNDLVIDQRYAHWTGFTVVRDRN